MAAARGVNAQWLFGMLLVLAVAMIWVVASYAVQVVEESGLNPFVLTYICNSLFLVYIPLVEFIRWLRYRALGSRGTPGFRANLATDVHKNTPGTVSFGDWLRSFSDGGTSTSPHASEGGAKQGPVGGVEASTGGHWTRARTARLSLLICPFWFLAQYTFNVSLDYTSVSSNTILSSASSVFTFVLSVVFLGEVFSWQKVVSIALCLVGTAVVSLADAKGSSDGNDTVMGDVICLFSAFIYAIYTTLIRKYSPAEGGEDEMSQKKPPQEQGPKEMGSQGPDAAGKMSEFQPGTTRESGAPASNSNVRFKEATDAEGLIKESLIDKGMGAFGMIAGADAENDFETKDRARGVEEAPRGGALAAADGWTDSPLAPQGNAEFSTALMLGYLGVFNMLLLAPVGLVVHLSRLETLYWPSPRQWALVLGKGFLDNVFSDYLWARAVLLMTPTAATAGLLIQIPISMAVDSWLAGAFPDAPHLLGAVAIVAGFVGINSPAIFWLLPQGWGGSWQVPHSWQKIPEQT